MEPVGVRVILEGDQVEPFAVGVHGELGGLVRGLGGGRDEGAEEQVMPVVGHRSSLVVGSMLKLSRNRFAGS